jgi:hypothetical protein
MTGCCAGAVDATAADTIGAYKALTAAVQHVSPRVIVLGDPEGVGRQPVDCLLGRNATMKTCTTTQSDSHFAFNNDLAALSKTTGYRFLSSRGWFCFEYQCPMVIGRTIVYRDTGHITRTPRRWSRRSRPRSSDAFAPLPAVVRVPVSRLESSFDDGNRADQ